MGPSGYSGTSFCMGTTSSIIAVWVFASMYRMTAIIWPGHGMKPFPIARAAFTMFCPAMVSGIDPPSAPLTKYHIAACTSLGVPCLWLSM